MAILALVACGRDAEQPVAGSASGAPAVADAARSVAGWPAAPVPTLPPELVSLGWPVSPDDVTAKFPELVGHKGQRVGDMTIKVMPWSAPIHAQFWIDKPGIDLRVLERAWGENVRDPQGLAVWFDPKGGMKASYPAKSSTGDEGLELAYYLPVLDRIAAAPDGMVPGSGPLLGQPITALDGYKRWIASRHDTHAAIHLPPGEWDELKLGVSAFFHRGRIVRVQVSVRSGPPPVDEATIRERLRRRWGEPTVAGDDARWTAGQVRIHLRKSNLGRTPSFELTFETK